MTKRRKPFRRKVGSRNYDDPQYKKWRKDIAKLDGYCCQWPGCGRTKRLQFHHIKRWSDYPSLRYELDNGITLCREHHDFIWGKESNYERMFHKIVAQRKKNGKPVQYPKKDKRSNSQRAKRKRMAKITRKIREDLRKWEKRKKRP